MSKLILVGILLSTFPLNGLCESWVTPSYFKKINLKVKTKDAPYVKKTKQKLIALKWESTLLEKKCKSDTKKYFVENCARSREKLTKRTYDLVRELASAPK